MKVCAVIAEYNPFHLGHAYHLKQARLLTNADYVIVVMSGNFVQRGDPALIDKYARARAALSCGADLVLELPACFAAGSAEYFARGAISMLDHLGMVAVNVQTYSSCLSLRIFFWKSRSRIKKFCWKSSSWDIPIPPPVPMRWLSHIHNWPLTYQWLPAPTIFWGSNT